MHTRGRRILISGSLIGVGTTHAHAGQTIHHRLRQYTARNHPCTRGADRCFFSTHFLELEPPMHTRGRHHSVRILFLSKGTTHAHAGQTTVDPNNGYQRRNHPCTRGADRTGDAIKHIIAEPPMHTRGRRLLTRYNVRMSAKLYSVACIMQ